MTSFDRCDGGAIREDAVFVLHVCHRLQASLTSEKADVKEKIITAIALTQLLV
ncbi:MAG: hypothetical protein V7K41_15535 [Nostoc sp.]|uniref:hypothetical protein n=1 Tax=Nostoc sp. TaxID=1180 RepID=UPI002FF8C7E1